MKIVGIELVLVCKRVNTFKSVVEFPLNSYFFLPSMDLGDSAGGVNLYSSIK